MKRLMLAAAALSCAAILRGDVCIKDGDAIAFMGDSITQQGNYPAGYVNMVMEGLKVAGVKDLSKIPAGIGGHKSTQMNARLDNDVLSRKDGRKAQWMTFSCGVNDVWHGPKGVPLDKYKELVSDIFDRCEAAGVKVIVLTPTMIGEDAANQNNMKLDAYVAWLKEEAQRRSLRVADLNAEMKAVLEELRKTDKTPGNKLTQDGVHMAFAGNCMMAWGVLKAMGVPEEMKDGIFAAFGKLPEAHSVHVKLSHEEWGKLLEKAKSAGKNPAEILRGAIL